MMNSLNAKVEHKEGKQMQCKNAKNFSSPTTFLFFSLFDLLQALINKWNSFKILICNKLIM